MLRSLSMSLGSLLLQASLRFQVVGVGDALHGDDPTLAADACVRALSALVCHYFGRNLDNTGECFSFQLRIHGRIGSMSADMG